MSVKGVNKSYRFVYIEIIAYGCRTFDYSLTSGEKGMRALGLITRLDCSFRIVSCEMGIHLEVARLTDLVGQVAVSTRTVVVC